MGNNVKQQFSDAYHDYSAMILRHIYFRTGNRELAEDLMQETFFKTWQYINDGNKEIKLLKNFLFVVSNNLIADYYKNKYKIPVALDDVKEADVAYKPDQEIEVDEKILLEEIKKYMIGLKEAYRKIISYRYFEYLSIEEIAVLTKKSPNYISVILHRCKNKIKNKYQAAQTKKNKKLNVYKISDDLKP